MQKKILFTTFIAFSIIWSGQLNAVTGSEYLALITDLDGNVMVKKSDKVDFKKACWGMQLFENDKVRTSELSSVQILFSNNNLIELGSKSALTISKGSRTPFQNTKSVLNVEDELRDKLSMLSLCETKQGEIGVLGGLRSEESEQVIELFSPRNTKIKTFLPIFVWNSHKDFKQFKLTLFNNSGSLWTHTTSKTTLTYPAEEKSLKEGESYFWLVEGIDMLESFKTPSVGFSTLTASELASVESKETSLKETFTNDPNCCSYHFLLGSYYKGNGLLYDAIQEFEQISKLNTEAPLPHEILGHLYNSIGMKEKAITELQKAVELSRE